MAILGSGGGLLNGETQKAIMGAVPAERAGMASGISTTSRFSGILLGFAGLGSLLAGGVRGTLLDGVERLGLQASPERIERLVAGDLSHAAAAAGTAAGAVPPGLEVLVRAGFAAGFAHAFLAAAVAALLACMTVHVCMREPQARR
jgi:hypothetical protein